MQKIINLSIALFILSSMQIYGDAASIMADVKKQADEAAKQNVKNLTEYVAKKKTAHSQEDKEKYLASLKKRIDQIRFSNADTAQKIESLFLQVAQANVDAIDQQYLERPDGIKNAAKALAKTTASEATSARRKAGYKAQYTKDLKARIAELKKASGTGPKIEILLLEDYYS